MDYSEWSNSKAMAVGPSDTIDGKSDGLQRHYYGTALDELPRIRFRFWAARL
jgi:hypothetical protein